MRNYSAILWILVLIILSSSMIAAERIAVVTKIKGSVEVRPAGESSFKPLKKGVVLNDRDFVRTGSNGALIIVYLDDKSMLKVKSNSDLEIRGTRSGKGLSKNVDMMAGTLKAGVSKQRKGDFVISTPTSVASVKGTEFWMMSDPLLGDKVIGIEGLVELQNLISGEVANIGADQTGSSTPNGTLSVNTTDPDDIPEDIEEEVGVSMGVGIGGLGCIEKYTNILRESGPKRISPFFIPMTLSNLAPGYVSLLFRAKNYTACSVSACTSSNHAIGTAARTIERGDAKSGNCRRC